MSSNYYAELLSDCLLMISSKILVCSKFDLCLSYLSTLTYLFLFVFAAILSVVYHAYMNMFMVG